MIQQIIKNAGYKVRTLAVAVIRDTSKPSPSRLVHRNVTLRKVPNNCRVYGFVLRQSKVDDKIKNDLVQMGEEMGLNLFVGIWDMKDQDHFTLNQKKY